MIRVLDLFSGIGGFTLGLQMAGGFKTIGFCEIDPYCRAVLRKHWPDVPQFEDVTKLCRRIYECDQETEDGYVNCPRCNTEFGDCDCIGTDQFIDEHGVPYIIVGGDPCQNHSTAAQAFESSAASLAHEFLRIVDQLRPPLVLRENPTAVGRHTAGDWRWFRTGLERLGYGVLPFRFRACCAGADIRRDRMFLLAQLPKPECPRLERYVSEEMAREDKRRQDADAAGSNRWSATPRVCGSAPGVPRRMDRLRALGNSVVPQVVCKIGKMIRAAM